jgi:quercetin dioxygenase-like cupin family protein
MVTVTFLEFEDEALKQGFDEVMERSWDADAELGSHTHPFAVKAVVVRGEMWLTVGDDTKHLRPGDTFELARNVSHSERYGSEGATYWVARRRGTSTADSGRG